MRPGCDWKEFIYTNKRTGNCSVTEGTGDLGGLGQLSGSSGRHLTGDGRRMRNERRSVVTRFEGL